MKVIFRTITSINRKDGYIEKVKFFKRIGLNYSI